MSIFKRIAAFILSVFVTLTSFPIRTVSERAKDFRITAYVVGSTFADASRIDNSHFSQITDVILIGVTNFNTDGELIFADNFETILTNLKNAMKDSDANLYLNIIGPGFTTTSTDWYEQMDDQGKNHDIAFQSGKLENNIKNALVKYGFDGVFFDYEYPEKKEHWRVFDKFLISLDACLGDEYKIGCAISAWNTKQSRKSIAVTDLVEVMAYDIWDRDGTHASMKGARQCIRQMLLEGYKKEQLDLGLPFYARPTTKDAYWYDYASYYKDIDEKGFYYDKATELTFSFNTPDVIYEKIQWAINRGLGGAMVWHYACDVPADNDASLFNAMYKAKTDMIRK